MRILLVALVLVIYLVYAAVKYRAIRKKLSGWQLLGLAGSFIGIASIAAISLFYGSRCITTVAPGYISSFILQFVAVIFVMIVAGLIFMFLAGKITNGMIPLERHKQHD